MCRPEIPHSEVSMYMVDLHTIFMYLVHMILKAKESLLFCICFQWHNFIMTHNNSHMHEAVEGRVNQCLKDNLCPHQETDYHQNLCMSAMTWFSEVVISLMRRIRDALWNTGLPTIRPPCVVVS
jgi:hypothetical protein